MIKIAHARIGSNGKITDDAVGDNNGKEVCITDWYSKPWDYVIRAKDKKVALSIANSAKQICDINCGYDQKRRNDLIKDAQDVGMVFSKIKHPTSCDCSSFVTACCINAGVPYDKVVEWGNASTTRTLRKNLEATGMFTISKDKKYTTSSKSLQNGDILLSEGHHVAVAVEIAEKTYKEEYYPQYLGNINTLTAALEAVGEKDTTPSHREKIYYANGLDDRNGKYAKTADQNTAMLILLKRGNLKRA